MRLSKSLGTNLGIFWASGCTRILRQSEELEVPSKHVFALGQVDEEVLPAISNRSHIYGAVGGHSFS
jgi:hypothetical protein